MKLMILLGLMAGCETTKYVSDRCLHDVYINPSARDTLGTRSQVNKHNESLKAVCDD